MKTSAEIKADFTKKGYATVVYPKSLQKVVLAIYLAWVEFCAQEESFKERILFDKNKGYENKNRIKHPEYVDHKEDMHITGDYVFPAHLTPSRQEKHLLDLSAKFFDLIEPELQKLADMLSEITGKDFSKFAKNRKGWTLRLLHYYPQNQTDLAHYHPDRGGHTIHLFDSTPGLECFWNNKWKQIEFDEDMMAFFPGLLAQLVSECQLTALCHRVVSSDKSKISGRYSLVLFCDYPEFPSRYNKETYGGTQKAFAIGGNYDMDIEKFAKYFTTREMVIN